MVGHVPVSRFTFIGLGVIIRLINRRKLYVLVVSINVTALALAIAGSWQYPRQKAGLLVLLNLLVAIITRNELFGRFLYLVVNTVFAKVSLILDCLHPS